MLVLVFVCCCCCFYENDFQKPMPNSLGLYNVVDKNGTVADEGKSITAGTPRHVRRQSDFYGLELKKQGQRVGYFNHDGEFVWE